MKLVELEVFSEAVNCPVIRMTGRAFPGVLIQGDSLSILQSQIQSALTVNADPEEAREELELALDILNDYMAVYEQTLKSHDMKLPYSKKEA